MNDNTKRLVGKKVFVTQYSGNLSFGQAEKFGSVEFLSQSEYRAEPTISSVNDSIRNQIWDKLSNYIPGVDFILLTGSPMPTVLVGMYIASKPGEHKFLKWNNQIRDYEVVLVRTKSGELYE